MFQLTKEEADFSRSQIATINEDGDYNGNIAAMRVAL